MGIIKTTCLFLLVSAVDIYQYMDNEKPTIDFTLLFMAFVAAVIGSSVRIAYEGENKKVKRSRIIFIYACSICVSYMIYEGTSAYGYTKIIGVISIIGGIISVDIIKFFIEDLPNILKDWVVKKSTEKNNDGS